LVEATRQRLDNRQPLLTIIKRTITKPMLAAISMAPNTESSRIFLSETSFWIGGGQRVAD
jgi:hypothetical protein